MHAPTSKLYGTMKILSTSSCMHQPANLNPSCIAPGWSFIYLGLCDRDQYI